MECVVYQQPLVFLVPPSVEVLETALCSDPTQTNSAPVENNRHISGGGKELQHSQQFDVSKYHSQ